MSLQSKFWRTSELIEMTQSAAHKFVVHDAVVGASRSGLLVATALATQLSLPLYTWSRQTGLHDAGRGRRFDETDIQPPLRPVLVDDTVFSGHIMRRMTADVLDAWPTCHPTRFAPIVATPDHTDAHCHIVPGPHFLEWCFANCPVFTDGAWDMDGILCHDCPVEHDDDGEHYRLFLHTARPLHLPRLHRLRAIITGRHEKYRAITEAWLARHGVRYHELIMRGHDADEAGRAEWKRSIAEKLNVPFFIESSPFQASIISRSVPTLCPDAGKCFYPKNVTRCLKPYDYS